ncbi:hypothetical protein A9507_13895 [Methanobacterium sp. A39]|jgi:uncharacterized protein (UPF0305 family)|uniref:Uncharacterized protein n=1 Tax=Methanobacterium bryantii TaxID=2161 RepID=A0A2A2HA11_METBR|nr:hypothetical protein A9507_13895 [Methanobacterium sp. A39]PAV06229.1 hypothetical protein ASJ80_15475 [Methanobacterium bryantii]
MVLNEHIRSQLKVFSRIVENIDFSQDVPRQVLLDALKEEARNVDITDIMAALVHMKKETIYVTAGYREELDAYIQSFLMRIKKIQDNNKQYEWFVNADELQRPLKS